MNTITLTSQVLSSLPPIIRSVPSLMSGWRQGCARVAGLLSARARTPAQEAAELRALGMRLLDTEPGFASDLLAAADQHELSAKR